jgi:hypothetical protein
MCCYYSRLPTLIIEEAGCFVPFVQIFIDNEVGIADDGICLRTGREMLFTGTKACEFKEDINAS